MQRFKQWLVEWEKPDERIHHDPSIGQIKGLIKRASGNDVRVAIAGSGVFAGSAMKYTHNDLVDDPADIKARMFVGQNPKTKELSYSVFTAQDNRWKDWSRDPHYSHPFIDRLRKAGGRRPEEPDYNRLQRELGEHQLADLVPALRYATNQIVRGKRGESHRDLLDRRWPRDAGLVQGFWDAKKKKFILGAGIDSTDLMTNFQRQRYLERMGMMRESKYPDKESSFSERIHRNPSMGQLKALTKQSRAQQTRFAMDKAGDLYAGDAYHYTHADIVPQRDTGLAGYIEHDEKDGFSYKVAHAYVRDQHPLIGRLEKAGFKYNAPMWVQSRED